MTYMPVDVNPWCNFMDCVAGMGLAGRGICLLGGDWLDLNCPKFEDEDEWLEKWREREEGK